MNDAAVRIESLVKKFEVSLGYRDAIRFWRKRYVTALDDISLEIPAGQVFGILGPNGAGKTTLLKILSGLILPDDGDVLIRDSESYRSPDDSKGHLTYISGDERTLYWRLSAYQNLRFFALLNEIPRRQRDSRIREVLSIVGLEEQAQNRVGGFSSGMKQRLAIARGLISDPDILLLDEPTRSLDPVSARQLQNFIKDDLVGKREKTIILATHNMEEAKFLCNRAAILFQGKVKASDEVDTIVQQLAGREQIIVTIAREDNEVLETLANMPGIIDVKRVPSNGLGGTSLSLLVEDPSQHVPEVAEFLALSGSKVLGINHMKPSLTDAITTMAEQSNELN